MEEFQGDFFLKQPSQLLIDKPMNQIKSNDDFTFYEAIIWAGKPPIIVCTRKKDETTIYYYDSNSIWRSLNTSHSTGTRRDGTTYFKEKQPGVGYKERKRIAEKHNVEEKDLAFQVAKKGLPSHMTGWYFHECLFRHYVKWLNSHLKIEHLSFFPLGKPKPIAPQKQRKRENKPEADKGKDTAKEKKEQREDKPMAKPKTKAPGKPPGTPKASPKTSPTVTPKATPKEEKEEKLEILKPIPPESLPPEDFITPEVFVIPEHSETLEYFVTPEDSVTPEHSVTLEDSVTPEYSVTPEDSSDSVETYESFETTNQISQLDEIQEEPTTTLSVIDDIKELNSKLDLVNNIIKEEREERKKFKEFLEMIFSIIVPNNEYNELLALFNSSWENKQDEQNGNK